MKIGPKTFVSQAPHHDPVKTSPVWGYGLIAAIAASVFMTIEVAKLTGTGTGRDYILSAIPGFFFLIAVECCMLGVGAASTSTGGQYTTTDTWSSVTAGTVQNIWLYLFKHFVPHWAVHTFVYNNFAIYRGLEEVSLTSFVVGFVCADFAYYWLHRHSHECALLWAGHSMHHSGEHYNLSTALRQSWWQAITGPLWSIPAALILPPETYLAANQWQTLYQFWVHTCVIRRLGILEYIFVTPSNHRVHHDRRVHKNFAGVFIIWDRIFGTFHDELDHGVSEEESKGDETCYFGIAETINTWSEPATQFMMWNPVFKKGPLIGPGWSTTVVPRPLPVAAASNVLRFRVLEKASLAVKVWVVIQYFFSFAVMFVWIFTEHQVTDSMFSAVAFFLIASYVSQGLMLDGSRKSQAVEYLRSAVGVLLGAALQSPTFALFHVLSAVSCFLVA